MSVVRRSDCVPLPIVVCPVVAVVKLESRLARCVHCVENVAWQSRITYSEWVSVALVTKQPKCMSRVILSSVACPVLQYFSKLSHKRHDFQVEFTEHAMCVLIFCKTFVWNICRSKKNSGRYFHKSTYKRLHLKYPLFLSDFRLTSHHIFEKFSNIKFHENPTCRSRVVPCCRISWRWT